MRMALNFRRHRGTYLWAAAALALCIVLLIASFYSFRVRQTPFSATLDTTYLVFTAGDSRSSQSTASDLGLLASERIVDITIDQCSKLTNNENKQITLSCGAQGIALHSVQLSSASLPEGTLVRLSVDDGTVIATFGSAPENRQIQLVISATETSTQTARKRVAAGPWRLDAAGPLRLHISDSKVEKFAMDDSYIPLSDQSSVSVFDDLSQQSGITGENSFLILPELTKEFQKITLERGDLQMSRVLHGNIRHLTLNRKAGRVESFHVEVAGTSKALMASSVFSPSSRNEALTRFDAISGRDPRLLILALCGLVIAALSALSNIFNIMFVVVSLRDAAIKRSKSSASPFDEDSF